MNTTFFFIYNNLIFTFNSFLQYLDYGIQRKNSKKKKKEKKEDILFLLRTTLQIVESYFLITQSIQCSSSVAGHHLFSGTQV